MAGKRSENVTQNDLRGALHYEPITGEWVWRDDMNSRVKAGMKAGYIRGKRHIIRLYGEEYIACRLAWFYMTGVWPIEIDHANRNTMDDRWENLKES